MHQGLTQQELSSTALAEFREYALRPHETLKVGTIEGVEGLVAITHVVGRNFGQQETESVESLPVLTAMYSPVLIFHDRPHLISGYNHDQTPRFEIINKPTTHIELPRVFNHSQGQIPKFPVF